MPINSKQKGSAFERAVARHWRDTFGCDAQTSRLMSKAEDDNGVDLVGTNIVESQFAVQCKAVEKSVNTHKILSEMITPGLRVLYHKRNNQKTVVSMFEADFDSLILELKQLRELRDRVGSMVEGPN